MPRSRLTSTSQDAITDDGSVLFSMISGEQLVLDFTASWITNLNGYRVRCKVIEANNGTTEATGQVPTAKKTNGDEKFLTILEADGTSVAPVWERVVGLNGADVTVTRLNSGEANFQNIEEHVFADIFPVGSEFVLADSSSATELTDAQVAADNTVFDLTTAAGANNAYNAGANTGVLAVSGTYPLGIPTKVLYVRHGNGTHTLTAPVATDTNSFKVVFPSDLITSNIAWAPQPGINTPVYGFIGLEIAEPASRSNPQVWRPLRGQIQVLYSVLSA